MKREKIKKDYNSNRYLCDGTCDRDAKILYEKEDSIAYHISNENGDLVITEYCVYPGIWLCYKDAHTQKFTYPKSYPKGILEITHCREGRFEYDAGEKFFYLSGGDMSISKSVGNGATVYCPTQHYHGISIIIDPMDAPHCLSCFLDDVNVSPSSLMTKFCEEDKYFIMRSTARLEHIFSELYSVPEDIRRGYFKVKLLELMLFLSGLDTSLSQTEQRFCSKAQVTLAKQVCEYVNTHMEVRLTINQLAEKFYVSPTWLKRCFYSVYGESILSYIREYKMKYAAYILKVTNKSITEIATSVGYENIGKFSKAFRNVYDMSPTEYRRENVKDTILS